MPTLPTLGSRSARAIPLLAGFGLLVLALLVQGHQPLNLDSAWYLVTADAWVTEGLPLYDKTGVDTNPPMVIFVSALMVYAAKALGLHSYSALRLLSALSFAGGAFAGYRALRQRQVSEGFATLVALSLLAFGLSTNHREFAQRDHVAIALMFPYVCLAHVPEAHRRSALRYFIGGMLGLALCLKPHYVLLPAALGALRLAVPAWRRPWIRIEDVIGAAMVAAYLGGIWVYVPKFFEVALPMTSEAYPYQNIPFGQRQYGSMLVALSSATALSVWARHRLRGAPDSDAETTTLLVFCYACLACFAAFLAQVGYIYHAVPLLILARVAAVGGVALLLSSFRPRLHDSILAAAAGVVCFIALVRYQRDWAHDDWGEVRDRLEVFTRAAPRGSVANLSVYMQPVFPALLYSEATYGGRFPELWMLPMVIDHSELDATSAWRPSKRVANLDTYLRRSVVEDFALHRPSLVLVDTPGEPRLPMTKRVNVLAYFLQDPHFGELFRGYSKCGMLGDNVDVYCDARTTQAARVNE
jgi:hypothetical protein